MRNFNDFLEKTCKPFYELDYFNDYNKIISNAEKYKQELLLLNNLLISSDIEKDFLNIIDNNPRVKEMLSLLIAYRNEEKGYTTIKTINDVFHFNEALERYHALSFFKSSIIYKLITEKRISNFYDYYVGIETGMDTNGRKNRSGKIMAENVKKWMIKNNIHFLEEANKSKISREYGIDKYEIEEMLMTIPSAEVSQKLGVDINGLKKQSSKLANKRFDFVFKHNGLIYLVETNGYSSSGSKLNETSRSYILLESKIKTNKKFRFIWITQGEGWKSTANDFEQAFNNISLLFNLNDLQNNTLDTLLGE